MTNFDFSDQKIAVVGDVMLDRYLVGQSTRLSPEADVPVLENYTIENRLGGASNVALNIYDLGATPFLIGVIGTDEAGKLLQEQLQKNHIAHQHLIVEKARKTTLKTRVMKGSEHLLRVDQEDKHPILESTQDAVYKTFVELSKKHGIQKLIIQDYNKGVLTKRLVQRLIAYCQEQEIFVAVDPKFENIDAYKGVDLFKPNLKEVEAILQRSIQVPDDLEKADQQLRDLIDAKNLVITLGSKGLYLSRKEKTAAYVQADPLVTVDVCGAGDGVISFLTLAFMDSVDLEDLGKYANMVGRIICSHPGVSTIKANELKNAMSS